MIQRFAAPLGRFDQNPQAFDELILPVDVVQRAWAECRVDIRHFLAALFSGDYPIGVIVV
jgi:hypothetical protein